MFIGGHSLGYYIIFIILLEKKKKFIGCAMALYAGFEYD